MSKVKLSGKSPAAPDDKSPAGDTIANTLFKKLIENSHDGLTLLDQDLHVIYRSASAERINGWTAADRAKYDMDDLIHPDDRKLVKSVLNKVKAKPGNIELCQFRSKRFAGHYIWIECTFTNFLNDPDINAIVCNFRDITERKQNEEKIAESEHFTKTVTDNLPALIAYFNSDLYCLFANKPYMDWFEKQPNEILGVNKRDILDKEEFKLHEQHINEVLKGKPQRFERTFHRADGRAIDTDTQYLPDIENGKVKGFYSLIYDVTAVKRAEVEIREKTKEIRDILENITDGFIALDQDMRYTYANKEIGRMIGRDPKTLIGKNVWELFPEAVGTPTYQAMQTALKEKRMVCNEDYSAPINMWQENRVYPSGNGISMFIRNITKSKEEERHLKLLESVITNTTDAVLITEAGPLDDPGPRIIYVNEAFTRMTGYTAAEVIGKTPRILQGPKSDSIELKLLSAALHEKRPTETTTINYKKNGEEFWINFAVSPVCNDQGQCTHFIAIERDVTARKNHELQQFLLSEISLIFNETADLGETLHKVLSRLAVYGNFSMAEAWLIGADKNKINLVAKYLEDAGMKAFYEENTGLKSFTKNEGLPGITWETQAIQFWRHVDSNKNFVRHKDAKKVGLKTVYGVPLKSNNEVIGVLMLGSKKDEQQQEAFISLFESFCVDFGAEIKRKQLEQELYQIFNFAPDIICIAGVDGYFKKINPAMCTTLEYTEEELLAKPYIEFVHPDDRQSTVVEVKDVFEGKQSWHFENRYITKSGKIKVLAWTATGASDESLLFCVAKDITDRKNAEQAATAALEERNTILESIDDAFFAVDKSWVVTYWNNTAEKVLLTPSDKILNHNLWEVFAGSIDSISYQKYHEAVETNHAAHFEDYFEPLNKWYEISAYPSAAGLSVYFKDISDRKLSEKLLKELNANLQKHAKALAISNAELEQFAYVASHDLQEPLRMVTSFMTQLEKKYGDVVDDKGRQYIHFAVDGAKRMRQIILDLLDFSRVGRADDDLEEVDTNKLMNEILALYRRQIDEEQATITFKNLPVIQTYKTPMRQVFQNLVGNSLKYHKSGKPPIIEISCAETATKFQFAVKDNGIGIAPEYFDKIFIIFQRLHNKDEYSGTGMGLAIAKKIIESMGGKIWVESEEGKGSTFYFTILKKQ